ncbi:hypothetical protein AXF42_Ash008593 [Apostasia shenzhenica]|uniref:Uncharacterized protein n=1 Tax=Apostasia shenzhenica TaxID=1088818 RepID=A0A2I0B1W3_9ASPA|nr:hypothetical protein AXF42_Ash008593 [Apostasia shenzhenica]
MAKPLALAAAAVFLLLLLPLVTSAPSTPPAAAAAAVEGGALYRVACRYDDDCWDPCQTSYCPDICGHPCPSVRCLNTNCWCSCGNIQAEDSTPPASRLGKWGSSPSPTQIKIASLAVVPAGHFIEEGKLDGTNRMHGIGGGRPLLRRKWPVTCASTTEGPATCAEGRRCAWKADVVRGKPASSVEEPAASGQRRSGFFCHDLGHVWLKEKFRKSPL